jgi:hypothetical protein
MGLSLSKLEKKFLINKYKEEGLNNFQIKERIDKLTHDVHKTIIETNRENKSQQPSRIDIMEGLLNS